MQGKVPNLVGEIVGCSLKITWGKPRNCGNSSPVTRYAISVRSRTTSQFFTPNQMCGASSSSATCTIPMSVLMNPPYSLEVGERIVMRAAALNENGWGKASVVNSEVRILNKPGRVGLPSKTKLFNEEATLSWPLQ